MLVLTVNMMVNTTKWRMKPKNSHIGTEKRKTCVRLVLSLILSRKRTQTENSRRSDEPTKDRSLLYGSFSKLFTNVDPLELEISKSTPHLPEDMKASQDIIHDKLHDSQPIKQPTFTAG